MNILAIESAVADGSIAIIRDHEPALVHAGDGASRAGRILPIISALLKQAGVSKDELDLIAVATGPGSYSGIRIGMSTALGLRDSLGTRSVGISVLAAMSSAVPANGPAICAVPVGKNDVAWQPFGPAAGGHREATAKARLSRSSTFALQLGGFHDSVLFAPGEVLACIKGSRPDDLLCMDSGTALAEYIGRFAAAGGGENGDSMNPIYLRNQDAPTRSF